MEQSLGKRIAQYRKALGLTQDALAEKLGITAQAVSKWENDLSCPDIALLPRLAEIFGISTDTLLGRDASQVVHNAEVVDREETADSRSSGSKWEFHWDGGRIHALRFAVFVLLVGGLVLADRLLGWQIRFWDICWPSFVLVYSLFGLMRKFSFLYLGGTLLGGYYLALNLSLFPTPIDRNLLLPILLLLLGLSLLADALRKPKKPSFRIVSNGDPKKAGSTARTRGIGSSARFPLTKAPTWWIWSGSAAARPRSASAS